MGHRKYGHVQHPTSQCRTLLPCHRHAPTPVSAETYAAAGLPFFALPDELLSGIEGNFEDIKTVSQLDLQKGRKGLEKELEFPIIQLDKSGQRVPFRAVDEMEKQLKSLRIAQFT
jgi:hypothetical protein